MSAEDVLSFLNILSYNVKKTKSSRMNVREMSKYCNVEIIKNKVDDLSPEYKDEPVVENFLECYELFKE